jgi:molecular chaperone HscC
MTRDEDRALLDVVLERAPGKLSSKEFEETREKLSKLKIDPRALLPNRAAMARADARFAELTDQRRAFLGEAIRWFQMALASQDPAVMKQAREGLNAVVGMFGR